MLITIEISTFICGGGQIITCVIGIFLTRTLPFSGFVSRDTTIKQFGKCHVPNTGKSMIVSWTLLHFNARSICNKFDKISTEVLNKLLDMVWITKTWLSVR